jgi:hypothetical protein
MLAVSPRVARWEISPFDLAEHLLSDVSAWLMLDPDQSGSM